MKRLRERCSDVFRPFIFTLLVMQSGWLILTTAANYIAAYMSKPAGGASVVQSFLYALQGETIVQWLWYWWPIPIASYIALQDFVTWKPPDKPQQAAKPLEQIINWAQSDPLAALEDLQWKPVSSKGLRHIPYGYRIICSYGLLRIGKKGIQDREIIWTPDGPFPIVTTSTMIVAEPALDQLVGRGWMIWLKKGTVYSPIGFCSTVRDYSTAYFSQDKNLLTNLKAGHVEYLAQCVSLIVDDLSTSGTLYTLEQCRRMQLDSNRGFSGGP